MSDKRTPGLNQNSLPVPLRKSPLRYSRASVLKMLACMDQSQQSSSKKSDDAEGSTTNNGQVDEFLNTGRTGRRNALPDILSEHAHVSTSDLPGRLQGLTTQDKSKEPSTSSKTDCATNEMDNDKK